MRIVLGAVLGLACAAAGYRLGDRRRPQYTPAEMDEMRASLYSLAMPGIGSHVGVNPSEVAAGVDRQMLVHIANGTRPAELRTQTEAKLKHEERVRQARAINSRRS